MLLSDISIKRPVFTAMVSLLLIVLGIMGFNRLGTDLYPDVSFPVVLVNTVYRGAGPGDRDPVVKPIEDAVAGISGVDKIHSFSRENLGTVVVQFKLTANLDRSVQEVRDKVAGIAGQLPRDADSPVVGRVDLSATPSSPTRRARSWTASRCASASRTTCAPRSRSWRAWPGARHRRRRAGDPGGPGRGPCAAPWASARSRWRSASAWRT